MRTIGIIILGSGIRDKYMSIKIFKIEPIASVAQLTGSLIHILFCSNFFMIE